MKIAKWIRDGNLPSGIETTEELIEAAGRCLDSACATEAVGTCVFVGEDGKTYVGSVEFSYEEADPNSEFVKALLGDDE